jgi:ribonuclease HI
MELQAALEALRWLDANDPLSRQAVLVNTDSKYLANNFPFMAKWRTNGWTAFGSEFNPPGPVAIQDLWEAIDALARETNGTQIHPIAKGSHPNNVEWIGLLRRWQRKPKVGCEIRLLIAGSNASSLARRII